MYYITIIYITCIRMENLILEDKAVSMCKVIETTLNGQKVPVVHIILKKDVRDSSEVIRRIKGICQTRLESYAVPKYYKLRESFPVHTNGKRDVEALKKEKDGYHRL